MKASPDKTVGIPNAEEEFKITGKHGPEDTESSESDEQDDKDEKKVNYFFLFKVYRYTLKEIISQID